MTLSLAAFEKNMLRLISVNDTVILAISGGIDSMVACELMRQGGFTFEIAHMNFHLRGEESDADQKFIQSYSKKNKIKLHLREVNTIELKKIRKKGTQELARELRYAWLEELRKETGARYIVTGHHADDQAETILFHFIRGSGPAGLAGMHRKEGKIIRPLLDFSREEITACARRLNVQWREDSSNSSTDYSRNKIRHTLFPVLETVNPGIRETLRHLGPVYHEVEQLIHEKISRDIQKNVREDADELIISTQWLAYYEYKHLLLWQVLREYNFTFAQIEEVIQLIDSQSGKRILSSSHQVLHDRDTLLISEIRNENTGSTNIESETTEIDYPVKMEIQVIEHKDFTMVKSDSTAQLDFDKLKFPLLLRPWNQGDKFKPLGLRGNKKISDFLIQQKVTLTDKGKVFVLTSDGEICWVVGMRISDDFKVTPKTRSVWVATTD